MAAVFIAEEFEKHRKIWFLIKAYLSKAFQLGVDV